MLDDELPGLSYLKMLCEQIPGVEVVRAFNQPQQLIAHAPTTDYDLCLLDIEMPQINGLEVAKALAGKPVVFVTAYKAYAAEAFDLNAVDFVRKPISLERLTLAIEKVRVLLNQPKRQAERRFMQLRTSLGISVIDVDELVCISTSEIDPRDKRLLFADGTQLTAKNMSFQQMLDQLPEGAFCRVNKKELVALCFVHAYSAKEVVLRLSAISNHVHLTLGDAFRAAFLQQIEQA